MGVFKVYLLYLAEVVVDIKASASQHQELDQFADDGRLPLHHSYMESSVIITKNRHIKNVTVEREMLQKTTPFQKLFNWATGFPVIVNYDINRDVILYIRVRKI